ncbi:hypothetical protein EHQ24_00215 [Leptospira noumeaensis]|uniref:Uncharacterized protein n=1 Tax=Leptospira noumeaensis TaxID=2484964 RepID=A0A4R9IGY7_9LEPT|nr:hypothetical protein EHQ24_00215 [Leptospira noumeaensis]
MTENIVSLNITNVTADCTLCGNGIKASYEVYDDANHMNGDGCSNTFTIEPGFTCNNTSPSACTN